MRTREKDAKMSEWDETNPSARKRTRSDIGLVRKEQVERKVIMRRSTPTVSAMVDNAYQALAMQLYQYRESAHVEEWPTQKANAFGKLVGALVALQETERKNTAAYALNELPDEEVQRLAAEAAALLAPKTVD
jgi:hypothetical protein